MYVLTIFGVLLTYSIKAPTSEDIYNVYLLYYEKAEPEIAVGHWPFSDQFQDIAEQK